MITGEQIRRLRKKRGWSQLELADKVGIDHTVLSRIESGKRQIEDTLLRKFAGIFNVTTDRLLGHTTVAPEPYTPEYTQMTIPYSVNDNIQFVTTRTNRPFIEKLISVPVYNRIWPVNNNTWTDSTLEEILDYIWIAEDEVGEGKYFFLKVHQNNMAAAGIRAGGLVLVRKQDTLENGDIGLVHMIANSPALIARFWRTDSGLVVLCTEDRMNEPLVEVEELVKIIGKVVESRFKL